MSRIALSLSFWVWLLALYSASSLMMAIQNLFAKKPLPPTKPQRAMSSPQPQPQESGQDFEVPDFIDPTGLTKEELKLICDINDLESLFHSPSAVKPSSNAW